MSIWTQVQTFHKNVNNIEHIFPNIVLHKSTVTDNSERSDECIDFTMIITSRNNASISNFGGGFRWKSEYPWCIIEFEFIRNMSKLRKFASNFVVGKSFENLVQGFPYIFLQISYKSVDKIFLALSKYLKIFYKVPHVIHTHNFFLLAFEVQILTKIRQNYEYLQIILPLKHKPPFSPTAGNYILG
ncbi:hypothetical protein AGLY_007910 [Aphis glycines]|uniref:Uncharacterized protein n=1 Tax=Aphis glycines TaxID=307491 RepID=A0A6G0TNF1_APHGL|nr:hypothetical protein AGLY_007910 [Aphis glycines]